MKRMNLILGRRNTEKQPTVGKDNTEALCQKACDDITETFVTLANEPSLAYFRIQEHVRKSTPTLLDEHAKILKLQTELQGRCFDLDYAIGAINSASRATSHLLRLNELLKSSLFTKLQLDYAQRQRPSTHRREQRIKSPPSVGTEVTETNVASPMGIFTDSFAHLATDRSVVSPKMNNLSSSMSVAAVEVRQRATNLTKRALFTRSADISCTDFVDVRSALSFSDIAPAANTNGAKQQPSCESLLQSDPTTGE